MSSDAPYNNYAVMDLSGNQQPYLNSTIELGYFTGVYLGTIATGYWYSLPAFLTTNNRIANVDASGGLAILNAGIYKINLSLYPTSTQIGTSNMSFNFGTTYLYDVSSASVINAFGGANPSGMFSYDPFYNASTPGIISWVANGYSSGNSTISNFVQNPQSLELAYSYYNAGVTNFALTKGICTTEITFVLDSSATIFFNVYTSGSGVTFGNCCFTLQLMSSDYYRFFPPDPPPPPPPISIYYVSKSTSNISGNWSGIASDATGVNVYAILGANIYKSTDYGNNFALFKTMASNSPLLAIAVSPDATVICCILSDSNVYTTITILNDSGTYLLNSWTGSTLNVYVSATITNDNYIFVLGSNNGATTSTGSIYYSAYPYTASFQVHTHGITGTGTNIGSAAATSHTLFMTTNTTTIYNSTDSGLNLLNLGPISTPSTNIASDSTGKYLAVTSKANGLYTSDNSGNSWTRRFTDTQNWKAIASSSDGAVLIAGINVTGSTTGTVYISTNYGVNWSNQIFFNGVLFVSQVNSLSISSDGTKFTVAAYGGTIYYGTIT